MWLKVQDLTVYQQLCRLHLKICDVTRDWPVEEEYELGQQIRRSSNSSPAQLAEKHNNRHLRNRIEGINGSRDEANETIHHLYVASLKGYVTAAQFEDFRAKYEECIRMLNGLERKLEQHLPRSEHRWPNAEREPTEA